MRERVAPRNPTRRWSIGPSSSRSRSSARTTPLSLVTLDDLRAAALRCLPRSPRLSSSRPRSARMGGSPRRVPGSRRERAARAHLRSMGRHGGTRTSSPPRSSRRRGGGDPRRTRSTSASPLDSRPTTRRAFGSDRTRRRASSDPAPLPVATVESTSSLRNGRVERAMRRSAPEHQDRDVDTSSQRVDTHGIRRESLDGAAATLGAGCRMSARRTSSLALRSCRIHVSAYSGESRPRPGPSRDRTGR